MKRYSFILLFGLLGALAAACSEDEEEDQIAFCTRFCVKLIECAAEAQPDEGLCKEACQKASVTASPGMCTNEAAIIAKQKTCVDIACPNFPSCFAQIPECMKAD